MAKKTATGPAPKDAAPCRKFPVNESDGAAPRGNGFDMGTDSAPARKKIMGLRYKAELASPVSRDSFRKPN